MIKKSMISNNNVSCGVSHQNNIKNGVFPASLTSWLFVVTLVLGVRLAGIDPSLNLIDGIHAMVRPKRIQVFSII